MKLHWAVHIKTGELYGLRIYLQMERAFTSKWKEFLYLMHKKITSSKHQTRGREKEKSGLNNTERMKVMLVCHDLSVYTLISPTKESIMLCQNICPPICCSWDTGRWGWEEHTRRGRQPAMCQGGESRKDKTNGKRSGLRIKAREGGVIKGTA